MNSATPQFVILAQQYHVVILPAAIPRRHSGAARISVVALSRRRSPTSDRAPPPPSSPCILRPMDRLWTPWRYDYVSRAEDSSRPGVPAALSAWSDSGAEDTHCVFCNMHRRRGLRHRARHGPRRRRKAAHLLARGPSCFLCLNAFPYTTGHILIVPYRHLDSLAALPPGEASEMISLAQRVESVLRERLPPLRLQLRPQSRPGRRRWHRQPHPHARSAPLDRRHQLHDRHRQHPRPARGPRHHLGTHSPGLAALTAPASGCPIHRALCDGSPCSSEGAGPSAPECIGSRTGLQARVYVPYHCNVLLKGTASLSCTKAPFCLRARLQSLS